MKPGISSDVGVKALETLLTLKQYAPPNILQIGYPELNDAYLKQNTAMVIQWNDLALKAEDSTKSKTVGMNGYAPSPVRNYMPYSRVMAISAYSSNPHNSYKMIQYMNRSEIAIKYVYDPNCGEDPYRTSLLNDVNAVKDHSGKPSMSPDAAASYVAANKAGIAIGYPELSIPGAPRYIDILDLKVNEALSGSSSPSQALKACADEWNSITTSLGKDQQVKAYGDWVDSFHKVGIQY